MDQVQQSGNLPENRQADFNSLSARAAAAIGAGVSPSRYISYYNGGLAATVALIGSDNAEILVDRPETVSDDLTVPANIVVTVIGSGAIAGAANKTITFLGGFFAAPKTVFSGGAGTLFYVVQSYVNIEWWGGFTGATPMTQALNSVNANYGGVVKCGVGNFDLKDNKLYDNCFIVGSGWNTALKTRSDASRCGIYFVDGQARRGIFDCAIVDTFGKICLQWQTPDAAVRTSGLIFDRLFCSSNVSGTTVVEFNRAWSGSSTTNPEVIDIVWNNGIIQAPTNGNGMLLNTVNSKMDLNNMQFIGGVGSTPINSTSWYGLNVNGVNFSGVNMTANPATTTNRTLSATAANNGTYGVGQLTLVGAAAVDYFSETDIGLVVTYNSNTYYIVQVLDGTNALVNANTGVVGATTLVIKNEDDSTEQANAAIMGAFVELNVRGGVEEGFNYSLYAKDGPMTSQTYNYSGYLYQGKIKLEGDSSVQTFNDRGGISTLSNPFMPTGVGIKRVSVDGFIIKNTINYQKSVFEPKLFRTISAGLLRVYENYVALGLSAPAVATNFYINNTYKLTAIQPVLTDNTAPITCRNSYNAGDAELFRFGLGDSAYDYYGKRSVTDGWLELYGTQVDPYKGFRFKTRVGMPNLPTSSAGLTTGDVWVDTTGALNILKVK